MLQVTLFESDADESTPLSGDSHVRTSPQQERVQDSQALDPASIGKYIDLQQNYAQLGYSLRMSLLSELEAQTPYSFHWLKSDTLHGLWWWVLGQSEPLIGETESGCWPTPTLPSGGRTPKGGEMTETGMTPDGKKRQVDLNYAVTKLWPTPTSRDHKSIHASPDTMARNARPLSEVVGAGLQDQAKVSMGGRSQGPKQRLNARWVLQLMGAPSDWLDIGVERLSRLLATRSSRKSRK